MTTTLDILFCQDPDSVTLDFVKNKLIMEEIRQNKNLEEKCVQIKYLWWRKINKVGKRVILKNHKRISHSNVITVEKRDTKEMTVKRLKRSLEKQLQEV